MRIKRITKQILEEISLPKEEYEEYKKIAESIIKQIKKQKIEAKIGGSFAKQTVIKKDNQDIDIFVQFEKENDIKKLDKILKKIKTKGKLKKVHGSRDYFQLIFPQVTLEIIPTVKIKNPEEANNITDLSLSHVKYINKKTRLNPRLRNEIKLAKLFCQAAECYGAESYIQGFSGYALELLVYHYRTFKRFLKKVEKEKIIDIEKQFKNKRQILREINSAKLISPIILIDPTFKHRNVTAALNNATLEKFIEYKNQFLRKPSVEFFKKRTIDKEKIKKYAEITNSKFMEIEITTKKQEGDIAGTKMKKYFNFLITQLKNKEQKVLISEFIYKGLGQKATGYLVVKEKKRIEVEGPEIKMREQALKFKKARKEVFEKDNHIWAMENVSIKRIFNKSKTQQEDMGVKAKIISKL
jgi:tRNA CCA-adding enzyme